MKKSIIVISIGLLVNAATLFVLVRQESVLQKLPETAAAGSAAAGIDSQPDTRAKSEAEQDTESTAAATTQVWSNIAMLLAKETVFKTKPPVDLNGIADVDEKVRKIFDAFLKKALKSKCYDPSEYADQMVELGPAAVPALLNMLEEWRKTDPQTLDFENDGFLDYSFRQDFLNDVLSRLLTDQHKDLILDYFKNYGMFAQTAAKYRFPEAEALVMEELAAVDSRSRKPGQIHFNSKDEEALVDAALAMNEERALPILIEQLQKGNISETVVQRLSSIPDLDLRDTLRAAAASAKDDYRRKILLKPMLERGMEEGLDLAITLLKPDSSDWIRNEVRRVLPNYTGALGTPDELAAWLQANRSLLIWNSDTRRFEMRQ